MLARRFVALLRSNARSRVTSSTQLQQTSLAIRAAPSAVRNYADEPKRRGAPKKVTPKLDADGKPMRPKRLPAKKVKKTKKKPKGRKPTSEYQKKVKKNQIRKKAIQARKDRRKENATLALQDAPTNKKLNGHSLFMKQIFADMPAGPAPAKFTEINEQWNSLSDADKQTWKTRADEYNVTEQEKLDRWVQQHTPAEIRAANVARDALRKRYKSKGAAFKEIKDDRAVKRPRSSYIFYGIEWRAQREKRPDAAKAVQELAAEWKALSGTEKQKYIDMAAEDKDRYLREHESVFGYLPKHTVKAKKDAASP